MDVDGVMTDSGMYYSESGDEFKKFNARDGLGIRRLASSGFPVGIISNGINKKMIQRRAELLKIKFVHVAMEEKLPVLEKWCKELGISMNETAFIGDDINDIPVLKKVGFPACPGDAVKKVKAVSKFILKKKGGEGCVREFIEKQFPEII